MLTLKRIFNAGVKSFWRNGSVSFASILIMLVTLSIAMAIPLSNAILQSTQMQLKNQVDINVYFIKTAEEGQILAFKKSLETINGVSAVFYTSREQALENFKARHQDDADGIILRALEELDGNPLLASLTVRAESPSQFQSIAVSITKLGDQMGDASILKKITYEKNKIAINNLTRFIETSNKLGSVLIIIFALIAVLITFNTIRLAIYTSRDEIAVMRLVGASKGYIRGPFLVAGMLYGVVSTLLVVLIFIPLTMWLGPITEAADTGINIGTYYLHNILPLAGIVLLSSLLITIISSLLATKRYLKI